MRVWVLCVLVCACSQKNEAPPPAVAPHFVAAPAGDVTAAVRTALQQATKDRQKLLVYVSASWCGPCKEFQAAVDAGKFKKELLNVRMMKFDADADKERLEQAGYSFQYIPLFVRPGDDGRGTAARVEGTVKAPTAVKDQLVPRVARLVN